MMSSRLQLPVDALLGEICRRVGEHRCFLLQAAPGSGKTTRVPPALLAAMKGEIRVLEPRRLAARLSAERVAAELGEECGRTAGYQMRFEKKLSAATRLRFITEGIFLRLLVDDPTLKNVDCVVLDEFHERHLQTDIALAVTRQLQRTVRPDLKLLIMSATIDARALEGSLDDADSMSVETPVYPVDIEHRAAGRSDSSTRPIEQQLRAAVGELLADARCPGHILVFLPGVGEIRRAADALQELAATSGCTLMQLYADAPAEQQQKAFAPSPGRRKIILSTNVAETSVTIDGVTGIVDTGLARIAGHDPWSGLPTLEVRPVSKSSCVQRAGRAGRTGPGVAIRLFSQHDYAVRPAAELPEILRSDLAEPVLSLMATIERLPNTARPSTIEGLPWLDAPPETALSAARSLLRAVGAVAEAGDGPRLTAAGRRMAGWPLHPRLSRTLIEGEKLGVGPQAALAAVLLNEGSILRRDSTADAVADSDLSFQAALMMRGGGGGGRRGLQEAVDPYQVRRVEKAATALAQSLGCRLHQMLQPADEALVAAALLAGFPDRVAAVRKRITQQQQQQQHHHPGPGGAELPLLLCDGSSAVLTQASVVRQSEFLIALEAEQTRGHRAASSTIRIRMACGLDRDLLAAYGGDRLRQEEEFLWDAAQKRARGVQRLRYGSLILEESPVRDREAQLEEVLARALREQWPQPFAAGDAGVLPSLAIRASYLPESAPRLPDLQQQDGEGFGTLLAHICSGKRSFAEIARKSLEEYVREMLPQDLQRLLSEYAPGRLTLASGRKAAVHYEAGKRPWIAAPLQEFIGMTATPRIGRERLPVVVHLLAPNGRPVQVTDDLQSFWKVHYPKLRNALSRRYPKHRWP